MNSLIGLCCISVGSLTKQERELSAILSATSYISSQQIVGDDIDLQWEENFFFFFLTNSTITKDRNAENVSLHWFLVYS